MKKVLFFAAVMAVAAMTFVSCGKKEENKEVSRAEQAVLAIEAATTMDEVMAVVADFSDVKDEDFTEDQLNPYTSDCPADVKCRSCINRLAPKMAQLTAIRGRNMPSELYKD